MEVKSRNENGIDILSPEGRIDTSTAKDFEDAVMGTLEHSSKIIVQFNKLDYISSAGLRVMLMAQKRMGAKQGLLVLAELPTNINEVFKMSGFSKILKICNTLEESKQLFN
jgi:anti-anti-sigma factor